MKHLPVFIFCIVFPSTVLAIWNGIKASEKQFPYVVSIQDNGKHICTGVLYHPKLILTSALCFRGTLNSNHKITVLAGVSKIYGVLPTGYQRVAVKDIFNHPFYDRSKGNAHAVAFLVLETPLQSIQPIEVSWPISDPTACNDNSYEPAISAGWGGYDHLRWIHMRMYHVIAGSSWFVNASTDNGKNVHCKGDMGAPLINPSLYVVGMAVNYNCEFPSRQRVAFLDLWRYDNWMRNVSSNY